MRCRPTSRNGFTLPEILVAVFLLMLILLLLFRGVQAVTETVAEGTRANEQQRRLSTARRVMREDLETLRVHPDWPVAVGDPGADPPALALAFLRDRAGGTNTVNDTEWVQYWREANPDVDRLEQWVRYADAADDRDSLRGDWWTARDRTSLEGEVLLDELIDAEWTVWDAGGVVADATSNRVESVRVRLVATTRPLPPVPTPVAPTWLGRMREEEGSQTTLQVRPRSATGPEVTE